MLFDQLMVALQKVVDNQAKSAVGRGVSRSAAPVLSASPEIVSATEDHAVSILKIVGKAIVLYLVVSAFILFFFSDGFATTWTIQRTSLLALLLQRCYVLQKEVIMTIYKSTSTFQRSEESAHVSFFST